MLTVASYNVHKCVGTDGRRDPARILRVLDGIGADVVVLQEVDRRLGARPSALPRGLIERETDYLPVPLARNDVSLGWHGNAVLVRRGIEIDDGGHIDLPGLEPRGAVFLTLRAPVALTLVGTHLGLLRPWRNRQMRSIADAMEGRGDRLLIAGDFNEWADGGGFEPWMDRHLSVHRPGRSFHARRPLGRLDGFAAGPGLRLVESGVDRSALARQASDHLPVWARVEPI